LKFYSQDNSTILI